MRLHRLRNDRWDRIKDDLPVRAGSVGFTAEATDRFVDAVLCHYRNITPRHDLPDCLGDWNNTHWRSSRWAKRGMRVGILSVLTADAGNEYATIDGTIVRAHQYSAGAVETEAA